MNHFADLIDRSILQLSRPLPLRTIMLRKILKTWRLGSFDTRVRAGAVPRPNYAWCLYFAALEAKLLGHRAVTVIELGVAGGNGLACLCDLREEAEKALGIQIQLVGFDAGNGLPSSDDPRDVLYFWPGGSFPMDQNALEARIRGRAQLVIGDVSRTIESWEPDPHAPVGAILFDLDLYSSTTAAFRLFRKENLLPRVWCYFDDICGGPENAFTDRVGEREAIRQFNLSPDRNILRDHLSPAYAFKNYAPESWHQQIYLYHRMSHPQYSQCKYARGERSELPLTA